MLEPLFFASIGFAIPFLSLWEGQAIWHGVVYTLVMLVGKVLVGVVIPACDWWRSLRARRRQPKETHGQEQGRVSDSEAASISPESLVRTPAQAHTVRTSLVPAGLLGMAMVARGEIGLLIIEIGYNNTAYVTQPAFLTAVWAILLNTIIGPIVVGLIVKHKGEALANGPWGTART